MELEIFLRQKAVFYEKRDRSRTFLKVVDGKIVAYFSLALTVITEGKITSKISNGLRRRMDFHGDSIN